MLVALDAACADLDASASRSLRECDPLEIRVLARIARRIELGRTDTVRIAASHAGSFRADDADICSCHIRF